MKKLTAFLTVIAFSVATVMQAGEGATCDKSKGSCSDKAKASTVAKSSCSDSTSCGAAQKVAVKVVKPDEKGATLLVKR